MGYLVVGLEQQHGVDAVGRELWIVGLAEDCLYVLEVLFFRSLANVLNCLWVDVHRITRARAGDAARGAHREPARAGTDVGNVFARRNAQHVHDAVDLQALIAPRGIENGEIASVRAAGLALSRRWGGAGLGTNLSWYAQTCQ